MVDDFVKDLTAGKKVILVAHSQGNFFANAAYRFIARHWPQYVGSIGIVAIGSSAPLVEGGGLSTQNTLDSVIFGSVTIKYRVIPANVRFKGKDPLRTHHGFATTYMRPENARGRIVGHINQTINRLKTPLSPCDERVAAVETKSAIDIEATSATQAFQGGTHGLSVVFVLGGRGGFAGVTFNAFDIPDGIRILERDTNNVLLTSNGLVSGIYTSSFPAGGVSAVDVYVQGNSNQNTRWELTITCPQ